MRARPGSGCIICIHMSWQSWPRRMAGMTWKCSLCAQGEGEKDFGELKAKLKSFVFVKFYWNAAMPICLHPAKGCFHATVAE